MALPETLLKILVCPVDKGCLLYFADEDLLYNPRLRRGYRIKDGVPEMLAERAETLPEWEHERLLARASAGGAGLSAAGVASSYPGTVLPPPPASPYPVAASGGIAGPASEGSSTPA